MCLASNAHAFFFQVTNSTGTPESVGKALIAQTTTQFNATVVANPLAANTYTGKLFGLNPNYVPPGVSTTILTLDNVANKLISISTNTVEILYGEGMLYERNNEAGLLGYFMGLCANATNYVIAPSTVTPANWDKETCNQVLGYVDNYIVFQTSGVAVVPNPIVGF
jgi:hypothetical protein